MDLVLGPHDRRLKDVEDLLDRFMGDPEETGNDYLDYVPNSSPDVLVPEDVGVTLLMNSSATGATFRSIDVHRGEVDDLLVALPTSPL